MPWLCVRGARGRFRGVGASAGCCVFPVSPFTPRVSCAVCGGPSRLRVPYPRSLVRHSMRSVRSAGSVRLPFWFSPRVLCACVRLRSRGVPAPPPPWVCVARAPRAVPVLGAGRAVPRSPRPSACPASVPCSIWLAMGGGWPGVVPPTRLGAAGSPCGHGDPSPTPPRAPLRASFARCGGDTGVPGGGASCLGVGRPGSGALPPPTTRPFGRAAWAQYQLAVGAGGAGVGTRHQPHSARSCELALRAVGAAQGRPAGAPHAWVWGFRTRALSHTRPLVLSGVRPGPTTHWRCVPGVQAWGPVTNPTARAVASWLCALWGQHEGVWGGAPLAWASGVGRSFTPDHSSSRACGRGPLPTGLGVRGVRAWGPVPSPTARALASWLCALSGRHEGAGGGAHLARVWRARGRALSHPRPLVLSSVRPGPITHWLWLRGVQAWGPVTNPTARALASWLCALWRRHEGARGGGASCLGVRGRALSDPRLPILWGVLPGPTTHWLWVRGVAGVGTRHQPLSARSCSLAWRAVRAA